MQITLPKKFSEQHIDIFINDVYKNIKKNPKDKYIFDLTKNEWISNQNLLLFTGLIKYLYQNNIAFYIQFFEKNDLKAISEREAKRIYQLWEVWEFYKAFDNKIDEYTDWYSNNTIKYLQSKYHIHSKNELYDRFGITPFISLDKIFDYKDEDIIHQKLDPVYKLNKVVEDELKNSNCEHPFIEKTLSAIITKELYENFLDHCDKTIFNSKKNWAFMSISLKRKSLETEQYRLEQNFDSEELIETKPFFNENGTFKNQAILQFSFLDFGNGIPDTLIEEYKKENNISEIDLFQTIDNNEIIKFAFKHYSSRNPIKDKFNNTNNLIPRGLFDLLVIVKRYNGLLIIRSNYGKVLYNFANTENIETAYSTFGQKNEFFFGTFVTVYLPAFKKDKVFDRSVIKPQFFLPKKGKKSNNINIFSLINNLELSKADIYSNLIKKLKEKFNQDTEYTKLNYISFFGCDDERIIKKTIFFLLSDYDIYENNCVLIVHPPSTELINQINYEILSLSNIELNYKIHPLPLVYIDTEKEEIILKWLGVFNEKDIKQLNQILFEDYTLALSDFEDESNAIGNVNITDKYGNFKSKVPSAKTLFTYYERYESNFIKELIDKNNCLKKDGLYLCNSFYYQTEFLQLTDLFNNRSECNAVSKLLFEKIKIYQKNNQDIEYIAITASSHKLLNSLIDQKLVNSKDCIFFDNYATFENDKKINKITSDKNYILICDAISSGNLTKRISDIIESKNNSKLLCIGVLVNTLDENYKGYESFINEFGDRLLYIYKYPIKKTESNKLSRLDAEKKIIRINPYTNIPITFSINSTHQDTVLLNNKEFIELIHDDDIDIKFNVFNNLIHPYFYNTRKIFKRENQNIIENNYDKSLLKIILNRLEENFDFDFKINNYSIFYPKDSDIDELNFNFVKSNLLLNNSIEYYQLERYNSDSGWKFPHTTDYFETIIKDKPNVLIIDDGSCTGDSLLQMINELSYYEPTTINLLCVIGRIDDHKREFFSKIKTIKKNSTIFDNINVNIYFGSHWHIPTYYLDNNPNTEEIKWLHQLCKLQNTPVNIKKIAEKILDELIPKEKRKNDYKYLIKDKSGKTPKKDIIVVRNEIGKIAGYRFYIETFDWFNKNILENEFDNNFKDKSKNRYIELISICLLFEPYLYEKIITILPDIKEKIEKFIEYLVFGNKLQNFEKIDIENDLYYDWSKRKKDIIHLFFIVFKDNRLYEFIDYDRFKILINFSGEESINYILYKFLFYSSINSNDNKVFGKLLSLIDTLLQKNGHDYNQIKQFRYFVASLPVSDKDFNKSLSEINESYRMLNDAKKHKDAILNQIEMILVNIEIMSDNYIISKENSIKDSFILILNFIENILSFTKKYPNYLSKHINLFESNNKSLRFIHGQLSEKLSFFSKESNFSEIEKLIITFKNEFLSIESIPYQIFINKSTTDIAKTIQTSLSEVPEFKGKVSLHDDVKEKPIYFPEYIFEKVILDEIIVNLKKYSDISENIEIKSYLKTSNNTNYIVIEILNLSNNNKNVGGSIGTYHIENLNLMPEKIFSYKKEKIHQKEKMYFKQTFTFKSL